MLSLRRLRSPVDMEGGVAYYPNRETTKAIREGRRLARKHSKLHRHRCRYPCKDPAYRAMETIRFRDEIQGVDEDVVDAIENAIHILSSGSVLPEEWMERPLEGFGHNREFHVGKGFWIAYHKNGRKLVLVAIFNMGEDGQAD